MLDSTKKRLDLEKLSLEMMGLDDAGYKSASGHCGIQVKGHCCSTRWQTRRESRPRTVILMKRSKETAEQRNQQFET